MSFYRLEQAHVINGTDMPAGGVAPTGGGGVFHGIGPSPTGSKGAWIIALKGGVTLADVENDTVVLTALTDEEKTAALAAANYPADWTPPHSPLPQFKE